MSDFEKQVLADLAELKTHMRWLIGNGHQGRVQTLEQRVEIHEQWLQRARGVGLLLAGALTLLHMAIDWWK